jgi:hypothetical protein
MALASASLLSAHILVTTLLWVKRSLPFVFDRVEFFISQRRVPMACGGE